jgi:hypothetical protein
VAQLAKWKHEWTASTPVTTPTGTTTSHDEYLRKSEGSGWQQMAANDNLFLSRQDLLDFAKKQPSALPQEALPFLTHFSRDLNAPTYRPDPARPKVARNAAGGGNDAYDADKNPHNPALTYNPDLTAYDTKRERQMLPRRFPLERLKWVATPATSTPVDAEKAKRFFGLEWQGTYWKYIHARSNGSLYTLQDVPADREPNFFEILRATVLCGSLGRQYGAGGFLMSYPDNSIHRMGGVDGSVDLNILEMGACIIDQYDSDSYPTAIELPGPVRSYFAFGKEDVPYLNRTFAPTYRGRVLPNVKVYDGGGTALPNEVYESSSVLQSTLWRLHQPVKNFKGPEKFRIVPQHVDSTGGGVIYYLFGGWPMPGKGGPPGEVQALTEIGDYTYFNGPNFRLLNPELYPKTFAGTEYLEVNVPFSSTAFREPQTVHSPAHGAIAGYTVGGNVLPIEVRDGDLRWPGLPNSYDRVSGFLVGHALHARIEAGASNDNRIGNGFFRGDPIEIMLQYEGPDGTWRPYQRAEFNYMATFSRHHHSGDRWGTDVWYWMSVLVDPRTDRFGGIASTNQSWVGSRLQWPEGASMRWEKPRWAADDPTLASGVWTWWRAPAPNTGWNFSDTVEWWMSLSQVGCVENDQAAWNNRLTFAFKDPDDVLRPGVAAVNEYDKSMYLGNPMTRRYAISDTGALSMNDPLAGRPVILNRPFRSVAELAYAFRGTPWRDVDFLSAGSPDAGLLEVFCLYENPEEENLTAAELRKRPAQVVAGRVNLNAAGPEVIAALISGTARDTGSYINATDAKSLANLLVNSIRATGTTSGPLLSKSELVSRPSGTGAAATSLITTLSNTFQKAEDRSIKARREAVTRALADGTTCRAWNFTLDLLVQSGQLTPTATDLKQFQSSAERRYWIHFAIDRITGKLLEVQWEPVKH